MLPTRFFAQTKRNLLTGVVLFVREPVVDLVKTKTSVEQIESPDGQAQDWAERHDERCCHGHDCEHDDDKGHVFNGGLVINQFADQVHGKEEDFARAKHDDGEEEHTDDAEGKHGDFLFDGWC